MVWKQDLAKLKAQLKEEPAPPPKKVAPRPLEAAPRSMEEEDALFLAMMGRSKSAPPMAAPAPEPSAPVAVASAPAVPPVIRPVPAPQGVQVPAPPVPADFQEALAGLKGLKRLEADPLLAAALAPAPAPKSSLPEPPAPAVIPAQAAPAPEPEVQSPGPEAARPGLPQRIQLAAGMAIEVDGTLDLRGHSLQDALERVKDRTADAQYLRWRSLLVTLGSNPELQEGFIAMVASGGLPGVTRFAQAPVPMGGTQAWVLYLLP
ncbi:MAG TPA: hypothetical protein VJ623_14275 [Holophagaceae bacterium]|nr:hypothetical protein [Holophagaceae bacterium]